MRKYAQEMDPEIMQKHIALYVNDYSFDLGEKGKAAIQTLYKEAANTEGFPKINDKIFIS
jgi:1,4-dihydroxy-6-naphthoate synthase